MATIGSSTSGTTSSPFKTASTATTDSKSAVQKILDAKKTETAAADKKNFFYSETYLRLKAFEIRARIVMFQNLGMTEQYSQAQQEGQVVVQQYAAYKKAEAAGKDPVAAVKEVAKQIQFKALAPNRAIHINTDV